MCLLVCGYQNQSKGRQNVEKNVKVENPFNVISCMKKSEGGAVSNRMINMHLVDVVNDPKSGSTQPKLCRIADSLLGLTPPDSF